MDFVIDLDPTHLVLRATITVTVLTEELAEDYYQVLSLVASHGGPYAAIYDFSGEDDAVSQRSQGLRETPLSRPRTKTPRAGGQRAGDVRIGSYVATVSGYAGRTLSGRPLIGGSLRDAGRASRRLHAVCRSGSSGRLRPQRGVDGLRNRPRSRTSCDSPHRNSGRN